MQIGYWDLVGKPVRTADGRSIGRIADLVAEPRGERLCVTGLLVGPASLVRRISFKRDALFRLAPPRLVPWSLVARVADGVYLRADAPALEAHDAGEVEVVEQRASPSGRAR